MKLRWIPATAVGVLLVAGGAWAADKAKEKEEGDPSFWMQKKLEYSENILAGLATADFEKIGKNARSMNALSQMEKWVRAGVPEYRAQLAAFQHANKDLIRMADAEQLDGATLAYVQLALSCVNCHKVVRDSAKPKPK
jgi:mono/diheme cytochrome c family protein